MFKLFLYQTAKNIKLILISIALHLWLLSLIKLALL